jgi:DNA-binding NarL/FixJ family response regulator
VIAKDLDVIRLIKQDNPSTEVLLLCRCLPTQSLLAALAAGAGGFLLPTNKADDIVNAIVELRQGGAPFSPTVARQIVGHIRHQSSPEPESQMPQLTSREQEVVDAVVKGLSYKQIAYQLDVALETVRHHIKNIYAKFNVHSKTQLIAAVLNSQQLSEV